MEIIGKMYEATPVETGTSQNGQSWHRRILVIQTIEDYPRTIAMSVFGEERCKQVDALQMGATISCKFALNSRKYEGRWYSEITCIGIGVFQQIGKQQDDSNTTTQQSQTQQQILNNPAVQQLQNEFMNDQSSF